MEGVARVDVLAHHVGHRHEREADKASRGVIVPLVFEGGALTTAEGGGGGGGGGVVGEVAFDGAKVAGAVAVLYAKSGLAA